MQEYKNIKGCIRFRGWGLGWFRVRVLGGTKLVKSLR